MPLIFFLIFFYTFGKGKIIDDFVISKTQTCIFRGFHSSVNLEIRTFLCQGEGIYGTEFRPILKYLNDLLNR